MGIKIVTDSTADLSPELAQELEITVVPLYLRFGEKVYRDGVDIGADEFYEKLEQSPVHPSTSQPTPGDFAAVYSQLAQEADGVLSVHISSKMSGTCSSALQGWEMARTKCPVEVVDSLSVSMGVGLLAMAAARLALMGAGLQAVLDEVRQMVPTIRMIAMFDSLKYLVLGGRLSKGKALLGTLLKVRPVLTVRDGELVQTGLARTHGRGVEKLLEFARKGRDIQEMAIVHSTSPDEAGSLKAHLSAFIAEEKIHLARLGSALGVHGGPGTLILALRERR